jgi:hypothetical protein
MNGITSRENAQQAVIVLGSKDGAHPSVAHKSSGLFYRRARWKRDRILVPDHVRHVSHHDPLCLSDEVYRFNLGVNRFCLGHGHEFSSLECLVSSRLRPCVRRLPPVEL